MPDEVFNIWLRPHIEAYGPPVHCDSEQQTDCRWLKEFRYRPYSFWSTVRWKKSIAEVSKLPLEQRACALTKKLGENFIEYETSKRWDRTGVTDSLQRMNQLVDYVRSNGSFPAPIVCLASNSEWLLLDGHHRLAAAHVAKMEGPVVIWLGQDNV